VFKPSGEIVNSLNLDEYFCGFTTGEEWLLVATGGHVLRLDRQGNIVWRSELLAIDGVVIEKVSDGKVFGEGEWNPPRGWRQFSINLSDGC
jgi:hypothetical protein